MSSSGIEPLTFIALLLAYIWWIQPLAPAWVNVLCHLILVTIPLASNLLHRDRPTEIGVRVDNLVRSTRVVAPPTLVAALAILVVGDLAGAELRPNPGLAVTLVGYSVWGFLQQYALQAFVRRRIRHTGRGPRTSALVAAILFGVVHVPNPVLIVATTVAGYVWCRLFDRAPNLFTLGLSHGALAVLLMVTLPPEWLNNLRIGPGYWMR